MKKVIDHIASVGIIIRAKRPNEIFIEVKNDGYPIKVFRRCLCPIGGNWIGESAKQDGNTLRTFQREVMEELSLEKQIAFTLELDLLGIKPEGSFYQTPNAGKKPTREEIATLNELKQVITETCTPFGDYYISIPKEVVDRDDPENKHDGFDVVVSYWVVALNEEHWDQLATLQRTFKNLSNESITIITSLEEIVKTGTKSAFGHDRPLQQFFLSSGFPLAEKFPMINGISCQDAGQPLNSYREYLENYDVLRKPDT